MATPAISWLLLLSLLLAVTPTPCKCEERARSLLKCFDPAPALANGTEFRASLLPLLGALPSAAAPTGFAALRSDSDSDSTRAAFVRGLCFAGFTEPSECLTCLSDAAGNLTAGCGATVRRAGIWTRGCFVAYADTDASSPSEDAFRELLVFFSGSGSGRDADTAFYYDHLHHMLVTAAQALARRAAEEISGARMPATARAEASTVTSAASGNSSYHVKSRVWVAAQCARDGAAADCVRCLQDSARAVDWDLHAAARGVVAAVVGFDCYLRFEVITFVACPLNCE